MKALITGATRGIGFAIASCLLQAGHEVFTTGTSNEARGPRGCRYLKCDFADPSELQVFAAKIAELNVDVLVNNAGINKIGLLTEYELSDFTRIQQVNATTPFMLCRAVIPGMRRRKFGRIVNITSIFAIVSKAGRVAYSTSKFGLTGLTRALALEVAPDNILVNSVAPGFVDTELTRRILGEKGAADIISQIPIGRLAKPEEIARCVRFLVSEENTYVTGQTLVVDGGFTSA